MRRNLLREPFTDIENRHGLSTHLTWGSVISPHSVGRRSSAGTHPGRPTTTSSYSNHAELLCTWSYGPEHRAQITDHSLDLIGQMPAATAPAGPPRDQVRDDTLAVPPAA